MIKVRAKEDFDGITHKFKRGAEYEIPEDHLPYYLEKFGDKICRTEEFTETAVEKKKRIVRKRKIVEDDE